MIREIIFCSSKEARKEAVEFLAKRHGIEDFESKIKSAYNRIGHAYVVYDDLLPSISKINNIKFGGGDKKNYYATHYFKKTKKQQEAEVEIKLNPYA